MAAPSRDDAIAALRNTLADLYTEKSEAQRLAEDAGLRRRAINFSGSAMDFWRSILREAINSGRIDDLVGRALDEYPCNAPLRSAADDYRTLPISSAPQSLDLASVVESRHARDLLAATRAAAAPREVRNALARYVDRQAAGATIENAFIDSAIPLGALYVELVLSKVDPEYDRRIQSILDDARFAADARRRRFDLRAARRLSVPEMMTVGHRVQVVLGDPGSGKTTLLVHLRHQACRGTFGPGMVAFLVPLKHYALVCRAREMSFLDYVARHQLGLPEEQQTAGAALLANVAGWGAVFLLLDGLDEVSEDEATLLRVQAQSSALPERVELLVTSRRAGYPRGLLSPSRTCEVVELSDEAIRDLIRNWHRWIDHRGPEETRAFVARVFDHDVLRSMVGNPCLLSLLCYLDRQGALDDAPSGRAELYRRSVDVLRRDRTGRGDLLDAADLRALAGFSFWLFEQAGAPRQIFTRDDYERHVAAAGGDPSLLTARWLRTRLLSQWNAESTYLFTHLTFQEWFAARHLDTLSYDELARVVARRAFHPYWREVWRFFAGLCRVHPDGERRFGLVAGALTAQLDVHGLALLSAAAWAGEFGVDRAERVLGRALRDEVYLLSRALRPGAAAPVPDLDDSDTVAMLRDGIARAAVALDPLDAAARAVAVILAPGTPPGVSPSEAWPVGLTRRASPFSAPRETADVPEADEEAQRAVGDDIMFAILVLAHVHVAPVQAFLFDLVAEGFGSGTIDVELFQAIAQSAPSAATELFLVALDQDPNAALTMASSMTRSPVIGAALDRALERRVRGSADAIATVALALAVHGHPRAIELAARVIDEPASAEARHEAVLALGLLDTTESTNVLLRALDRARRPATIIIILEQLRQRRAPGGDRRLRRLSASRDPGVRWAALALAARRRTPADIALLRRSLTSPDQVASAGPAIEVIRRERVRACDDVLERLAGERSWPPRIRQALRLARAWRGLEGDASHAERTRALDELSQVWTSLDDDKRSQVLSEVLAFPPDVRKEVLDALRPHCLGSAQAPLTAPLARLVAVAGARADRASMITRMKSADTSEQILAAVALAGLAPEHLLDETAPVIRTRLIVRAVEEGILFYPRYLRDHEGAVVPYMGSTDGVAEPRGSVARGRGETVRAPRR